VARGKLVIPVRRRAAVLMFQDRKGLSERRACQRVGQHRSTQRREPCVASDGVALRARLRKLSRDRSRWGYRRAHAQLIEEYLSPRQQPPTLTAGGPMSGVPIMGSWIVARWLANATGTTAARA
jgi:hypothetical protein